MMSKEDLVPRVLVVEDDLRIGGIVDESLRVGGFETEWVRTAADALAFRVDQPDLVLLDIGLPDGDGFAVCRELRLRSAQTTIVMLTARRDSLDVIAGLESGADDYLSKPFSVVELMARVRAHLRRSVGAGEERRVTIGSLGIDRGSRTAWLGDRDLALRQREFDLLVRLAAAPGDAVSRETLMADVWDENWFGSTKTLDVHVAALRRKLTDAAAVSTLAVANAVPSIVTLRGHGYLLRPVPTVPECELPSSFPQSLDGGAIGSPGNGRGGHEYAGDGDRGDGGEVEPWHGERCGGRVEDAGEHGDEHP